MGAVPVLIMLAAVGVDYGWQPDGTTSARGDNVEYIIQIPPQQLQQVSSAGEITSTVDPSIQGRVSRVVVRIGTAPLPKDGGRAAPAAEAQSAAVAEALAIADASARVPIPEINDSLAQAAKPRPAAGASHALMKPDPDPAPQSGGYSFPEDSGAAARTNPAVSTDPVAPGRDPQRRDFGGQAAGTPAATAQGSAAGGSAVEPDTRPSTDPLNPSAGRSQQPSWPASTAGSAPPAGESSATTTPGNRPTDPSDPNWSGYGTTPNFGTLPPGMSPPAGIVRPPAANSTAAAAQSPEPQRTAATGQASGAPASDPRFSRDAAGNLIDRLGRTVDNQGRVIDPDTGYLLDAAGNLIDQYGRLIDRRGGLLPNRDGTAQSQPSGSATLQAPLAASPFAQQSGPSSAYGQAAQSPSAQTMPPYGSNTAYPPAVAYNNTSNSGYGAQGAPVAFAAQGAPYAQQPDLRDPRQGQNAGSRAGSLYNEDNFRSPSDTRPNHEGSAGAASASSPDRDPPATAQSGVAARGSRTVAAQPFFMFLLLISAIGNVYLIYETGNLRRKFRNMVANVRAAKLSAQPAN